MNNLEIINKKIFKENDSEFVNILNILKFQDKKIVFTNGVFDILHRGHIDYLSKAKDLGNILIVGINSDYSAKRLKKGKNRPIQDELSRTTIIAALKFVDFVIIFNDDTPYKLIKTVQPDILVKGSDYKPEDIIGYDIIKAKNGEVITIDYLPGYSTTSIENKIKYN
jgi:rfaE bifunctional protein nucleotidyltransferase chain/domain